MLYDIRICPRIINGYIQIVSHQSLINIYHFRITYIRTILLESKTEYQYIRVQNMNSFFQHQFYHLTSHILSHTIIHTTTGQYDFRIIAITLCTLGQIIRVYANAVSSNQPRLEGKKIPFGTCSLQHILSINPHTREYLGKLIDKGYIDITLRILNDFRCLRHLHRGSQMCPGRYNRSIHFVHFLTNFRS